MFRNVPMLLAILTSVIAIAPAVEVVVKIDGTQRLFAYEPTGDERQPDDVTIPAQRSLNDHVTDHDGMITLQPDAPPPDLRARAAAWCASHMGPDSDHTDACAAAVAERAALHMEKARHAAAGTQPLAGHFGLTPAFLATAERIFVPNFGTEQLAPLLHALVRFHRPARVVELGFGYTTPFLARALADNAANVASERRSWNAQRLGGVLVDRYYRDRPTYAPRLHVVDDQSQRAADMTGDGAFSGHNFAGRVEGVLEEMQLRQYVALHNATMEEARSQFAPGSIDFLWNDAQWNPDFLRDWWPLVRRDGGLLLLHNVLGEGELSRWCLASPRRVLRELFPGEKFEIVTLLEPHKSHQSSVAMLRRLDPARAPARWRYLWGGKEAEEVERWSTWSEAVQRPF